MPGVCWIIRIEQWDWRAGDVAQFNKLIFEILDEVDSLQFLRWPIIDFADDDGAHLRCGIRRVERQRCHRHKLFAALAVNIASEGDAVGGGVKAVPVMISCELASCIGGEDVSFVAHRAKSEARRHSGSRIEVVLVEADISARSNGCRSRNAIFLWSARIIRDVPTADVYG